MVVQVRVQQLLERGGLAQTLELEGELVLADQAMGDVAFLEPVRIRAKLSPTGKGILVQGQATGLTRLTCSRCLCTYDLVVEVPLLVEYRLEAVSSQEQEGDDEADWLPIEGEHIDLADPVRQHLLLALPMKPLCTAACPGLAASAGDEDEVAQDPRLAALALWHKKMREQEEGG